MKIFKCFFSVVLITIVITNCKRNTEVITVANVISDTIRGNQSSQNKNNSNTIETKNQCFNLLFNLIKSSNFSFDSWGITSNDFDIYIDEETTDFIRIKLLDQAEKQTIGWVKYHKKTNELFDESANLDTPKKLSFNRKIEEELINCTNLDITETNPSTNNEFNEIKTINLPFNYSYDLILEENNFLPIKPESIKGLDIIGENQKIAKLKLDSKFSILAFINYLPTGQSEWFLLSLDEKQKLIDKLLIYSSQETDTGTLSTTFKINSQSKIVVTKSEISQNENRTKEKIISESTYEMDVKGFFKKL